MLAIIIVSWNVRDLLCECLKSLQRHPATTHSQLIIVVDNASSDESARMVQTEFPSVLLIQNNVNRGFTGGNNDGIAAAEKWFTNAAGEPKLSGGMDHCYVLLLNPDTEVMAGTLDNLLRYADEVPSTGLLGPQLLNADGSVQSSRRRFPTLATALFESTWLQNLAPRRLLSAYYMQDVPATQVTEVDWVYGAAMLVRRSTYRQVGVLDEQTYFMYSEEVDWCWRMKTAGWHVVYLPQARVVHHEGRSSEQVSARRMVYFNTSKVRYFRKWHGRFQATLLRVTLLSMFAQQFVLEGLKWLAGHKRSLRTQRMKAYLVVLRSRLA